MMIFGQCVSRPPALVAGINRGSVLMLIPARQARDDENVRVTARHCSYFAAGLPSLQADKREDDEVVRAKVRDCLYFAAGVPSRQDDDNVKFGAQDSSYSVSGLHSRKRRARALQ